MNLILMRTKVDHLNAWWEPHATSTPLKKIPAQLEIKNKAQKRVITQKGSANILEKLQNAQIAFGIHEQSGEKTKCAGSKRNRKSRLTTYFDPSSSSEDDTSEIKKRPIIKLGSDETNTKMFLKHEEPENEEICTINPSLSKNLKKNLRIKKEENSRKTLKNISETVNTISQNDQVKNTKNKTQSKTDACSKNICSNSDEENKIISNCKRNKPLINENKSFLEKKENSMNYTRSDENFRHPSDFNETERKKLKKTPQANHTILKSKQIFRKTNKNPQALKSNQKLNINNNELSKFQIMRNEEVMDSSNSSKNHTVNPGSKSLRTQTLKQMVNTASPLLILENKSNLSHQLFSESKEQECINILDLKSDEDDGVCTENKVKEVRPKTKMQTLEKHCIPKAQSPELPKITVEKESESEYILPKNDISIQNGKLPVNAKKTLKVKRTKIDCKKKSSVIRNQKYKNETKQKQKLINVPENKIVTDDPKSNDLKNQFVINGALNSNSHPEMNISNERNEIDIKDTVKCVQGKSAGDSSENSVFKQLDELSYIENGLGCSVTQCWGVNNLKCGVLKLKTKAQCAYQTLHSDSHLGGVLVKGHLRMKIGIKEKDMKEGDMAFVPPLTEWRATNIGDCESVFYYWCGRFGRHSSLN